MTPIVILRVLRASRTARLPLYSSTGALKELDRGTMPPCLEPVSSRPVSSFLRDWPSPAIAHRLIILIATFTKRLSGGNRSPVEAVYAVVKHASPRAEQSSILDSPQHLQELEPMYAIRPVYLAVISGLSRGVPIQSAISLISAASLFGIGLVVLFWTQRPLLGGLADGGDSNLGPGQIGRAGCAGGGAGHLCAVAGGFEA
jgi:hypothetical protein